MNEHSVQFEKEAFMCYEYEWEYMLQRAEDARKAMQKAEQDLKQKPKPGAPAQAPKTGQEEPVPV
jgi:hypothetical protein